MFEEKVAKLIQLTEQGILAEKELLDTVKSISKDVKEHASSPFNEGLGYELVFKDGTLGYEVSKGDCDDCYTVIIENTYRGLPVIAIAECGFDYCSNLHNIEFPDSLLYIGDGAFSGCFNLENIELQYTHLIQIGYEAFLGCDSLKTIALPRTVKYIKDGALCNCDSLNAVVFLGKELKKIPDSFCSNCICLSLVSFEYTHIEEIGCGAFSNCTSLKKVHLPATLKKIRKYAFEECRNLEELAIDINYESWNKIEKEDGWNRDVPSFNLRFIDCEITVEKGESYLYSEKWLKDKLAMNPHPSIKEQIIKQYLENN